MDVDNARPEARVYVTVDGQRWQMVPLEKLTWPETKELKRLSEMPMAVASKALKQSDPDAWFAWLCEHPPVAADTYRGRADGSDR